MPQEADRRTFFERISSAVLWLAAFCYACSVFFVISNDLRDLPPTAPVAVGRVTVDEISKQSDYLIAALYYVLVPILAVVSNVLMRKGLRKLAPQTFDGTGGVEEGRQFGLTLLFAVPFLFAPLFYLTTRKEAWGVLLPPVLAGVAVWAAVKLQTESSLRELFKPGLRTTHGLLLLEGLSWILFRYLGKGVRIAHIPTLFLEVIFVLFFLLVFWLAAFLLSTIAARMQGQTTDSVMTRFAIGASPLLLLPPLGLFVLPVGWTIAVVMVFTAASILYFLLSPASALGIPRAWLAWLVIPTLLFCVNYGSTHSPWNWTDLFHRGEALGPASDYLRGKVPYRDVFILHGLLDDGFLDAGLMKIFGRDVQVTLARLTVFDTLSLVSIWILGMVLFDSIPLAALTVAIALVTTAGAHRGLFEVLTVACLIIALRRERRMLLMLSGMFAGLGLFYSLDIGIYSIVGGTAALIAIELMARWTRQDASARRMAGRLATFFAGVLAGTGPFFLYLTAKGALPAFFPGLLCRYTVIHRRGLVAALP